MIKDIYRFNDLIKFCEDHSETGLLNIEPTKCGQNSDTTTILITTLLLTEPCFASSPAIQLASYFYLLLSVKS